MELISVENKFVESEQKKYYFNANKDPYDINQTILWYPYKKKDQILLMKSSLENKETVCIGNYEINFEKNLQINKNDRNKTRKITKGIISNSLVVRRHRYENIDIIPIREKNLDLKKVYVTNFKDPKLIELILPKKIMPENKNTFIINSEIFSNLISILYDLNCFDEYESLIQLLENNKNNFFPYILKIFSEDGTLFQKIQKLENLDKIAHLYISLLASFTTQPKLISEHNSLVYRASYITNDQISKFLTQGDYFYTDSFYSTTLRKELAQKIAKQHLVSNANINPCFIQIRFNLNSKGFLFMKHYSIFESEEEVLFQPGSKFKLLTPAKEEDGIIHIELCYQSNFYEEIYKEDRDKQITPPKIEDCINQIVEKEKICGIVNFTQNGSGKNLVNQIQLPQYSIFDDFDLEPVNRTIKNTCLIETLKINNNYNLLNLFSSKLNNYLENLIVFEVKGCKIAENPQTFESFKNFVKKKQQLISLDISDNNLTFMEFLDLLKVCPKLKNLNITNNPLN